MGCVKGGKYFDLYQELKIENERLKDSLENCISEIQHGISEAIEKDRKIRNFHGYSTYSPFHDLINKINKFKN